ncbi:ATP-binding cassette domain-containing protein [Mucisphaera sp.]|uniref:ATP-binding cassette domain-containing protein n=1 Tax=Mucisphaera sp. TaxID=2913024 RepID=UPI003D0E9C9D
MVVEPLDRDCCVADEVSEATVYRLEMCGADLPATIHHDTPLYDVNLSLVPGQLTLIQTEPDQPRLPIADALAGIIEPRWGSVRVDGHRWADLSPQAASRLRSQIGRVFEADRWVHRLSMEENLFLAPRHHRQMREHQLRDEAQRLCRLFGIPRIPATAVAQVSRPLRQKLAWVRALLGTRRLLILERPLRHLPMGEAAVLGRAVGQFREQGASVLWITDTPVPIDRPGLMPDNLARVEGTRLVVEPGPRQLGVVR